MCNTLLWSGCGSFVDWFRAGIRIRDLTSEFVECCSLEELGEESTAHFVRGAVNDAYFARFDAVVVIKK